MYVIKKVAEGGLIAYWDKEELDWYYEIYPDMIYYNKEAAEAVAARKHGKVVAVIIKEAEG